MLMEPMICKQRHETIDVRCAVCRKRARARRLSVNISVSTGPFSSCVWLKLPPGWWLALTTALASGEPHCRCADCLSGDAIRDPV